MTADLLREAAALMRQRAEPFAARGPWEVNPEDPRSIESRYLIGPVAQNVHTGGAEHIASWHPDVALAVADWLDYVAQIADDSTIPFGEFGFDRAAIAVARAYLGRES